MVGNSVKIEKFVLDYFEHINKNSDKNKNSHIYNILINCYLNSESNILDKKMVTLYFTDEQLDLLKIKQKELGYKDNFSRFVRYAMFDEFMKKHNIIITSEKFLDELINNDKFNLLFDKCKDELINGKHTSYDTDLLRNNKKYDGKISFSAFDTFIEDEPFNIDFLECDMLSFLASEFEDGKTYHDIEGFSTEQNMSETFIETDDETLEPFTDYDNIVPDTNSFYYLFLYYAFITDPEELDIDEIFNETDEHIELLLKKYTFEKIIKYHKQKYNITDIDKIFDKKCIESLKSDGIIELNENIKSDEDTKTDDVGN